MGRLKKFREASEVVSFRIPKITDSKERQFFKDSISWFIEQFAWIRFSRNLKENRGIGNIQNCFKNINHLLQEITSYYKIPGAWIKK